MPTPTERIQAQLAYVYGAETAAQVWPQLAARMAQFKPAQTAPPPPPPVDGGSRRGVTPAERLTERDAILITYGDQVQAAGQTPLQSLTELLTALLGDVLTTVHILPFYPYSSDDGFSVIDFKQVNPALGSWDDVAEMGQHFRLMFDSVANHISQHSAWFQAFLKGEEPYSSYILTADPAQDLSLVTRPRTHPLLTPFETAWGTQHVWTTFSADQIDVNYGNPQVLLAMTDVLLFYVERGASLIRLDAIGFIWKEPGTRSIHLPQAHAIIKLWRAVLDAVAPEVVLITETNVPHAENIIYFGDGTDEAQLVYQFPLPPLTVHAFMRGDASYLLDWAASLAPPSAATTFFNFLASHDGIGVRPVEGILPSAEVQALAEQVQAPGGRVSFKTNPDGSQSPYELNISLFDALSDPQADEPLARQVARFMAAQALLVSLQGVPGIYVHSMFGSRNWHAGVAQTGHNRTINRQKFERTMLEAELADPASLRSRVFGAYRTLLRVRGGEPAFHPMAPQRVSRVNPAVFSLVRTARAGASRVLCLYNVSDEPQPFAARLADLGLTDMDLLVELLTNQVYRAVDGRLDLTLPPYAALWLRQA